MKRMLPGSPLSISAIHDVDAFFCQHLPPPPRHLDPPGGGDIDLDSFKPKSAKDFEDLASAVVIKYLAPHSKSSHYKTCLKALFRTALAPLTAQETKDVETSIAGVRSEKLKEEKLASASGKKATKKATLNVGKSGGSAGLDDYKYDDLGVDDDYDFM